MKGIALVNPAITENTKNMDYSIIKVCAPVIDQNSGCVACSQCTTTLHFQLLQTLCEHSKHRKFPCLVLSLNLLMFHTEALMYIPQIIAYAIVEKGMENEGEQK